MAERQYMVISVMAKDRPGIVAEITAGISGLGGNLADLRQSVLCSYFTMIFVADFPVEVSLETVQSTMASVSSSNVSVSMHEGPLETDIPLQDAYILTAVGQERVGLVAQLSGFCRDHQVNILDLASHVDGELYTMMLMVDLSSVADRSALRAELTALEASSGLKMVLQHREIFRATNEV